MGLLVAVAIINMVEARSRSKRTAKNATCLLKSLEVLSQSGDPVLPHNTVVENCEKTLS